MINPSAPDEEEDVIDDDVEDEPAEADEEGQSAEIVVHQGDGRRVDGDFAAGGSHRDANIA